MKMNENLKELVLAVVRGQLPIAALEAEGINFLQVTSGSSGDERKSLLDSPSGITVSPAAEDIASGLLAHRDRPVELREWASFLLCAAELIDLELLGKCPQGDALLSGLWDASFDGRLTENSAHVAELLIR
jgi:hypothetical protein